MIAAADRLTGADWRLLVSAAADAIDDNVDELSRLDAAIGDGDHGVNVATALGHARKEIAALDDPTPSGVLSITADAFLDHMCGAAGALFGSFFQAVARSFADHTAIETAQLADALEVGNDIVARRGKARVGDKTMMDALVPAAAASRAAASDRIAITEALSEAAAAARLGAESTSAMTASLGRARYAEGTSLGIQDPGATTVALVFEAWAAASRDRSRECM